MNSTETTTCQPVVDRVYGGRGEPVTLCPDCGAIVPAPTGRHGDATVIGPHAPRVAGTAGRDVSWADVTEADIVAADSFYSANPDELAADARWLADIIRGASAY